MKLSIIIPAHNAAHDLPHLFAALLPQLGPQDECIVVNDGSRDDTAQVAMASLQGRRAQVLATPRQSGPAAARNLGVLQASGDVLLFLDADVVPARGLLERVRQSMAADRTIGALMGSYDNQPQHPSIVSRFRNLLHCYTHHTASREASTFWAGCGAVRRELFLAAGGFNAERFPKPSIEDIELGLRLFARGERILLDPSIQVKHRKRWTLANMTRTDVCQRAIPWTQLILESRHLPADLNLKPTQRASAIAAALLPVSAAAALVTPLGAGLAAVSAGTVLTLNLGFYRFLHQCGGWRLAAAAYPLHCVYFYCSLAGFAIAAARHARASRLRHTAISARGQD